MPTLRTAPTGLRATPVARTATKAEPPAPMPVPTPARPNAGPSLYITESAPVISGTASPLPVHNSKLKSGKGKPGEDQNEFHFVGEDEQRGYFDHTERNFFEGEDLDVPTYLRRGLKIHL